MKSEQDFDNPEDITEAFLDTISFDELGVLTNYARRYLISLDSKKQHDAAEQLRYDFGW